MSRLIDFVEYGSGDPSIVFECPLTSAASITDVGGTEEATSENTYDSTLGIKGSAGAGTKAGARFNSASISGMGSLYQGQFTIEVERELLAIDGGADARSTGWEPSATKALIHFGPGAAGTVGAFYKDSTNKMTMKHEGGGGTTSINFVNTAENSRFAKVTVSWYGANSWIFVDGKLVSSATYDGAIDQHDVLYLFSWAGSGSNVYDGDYYMRNLVWSNKSVLTPVHPKLKKILQVGDSFAGGQPLNFSVTDVYDANTANTVIGYLRENGINYGSYTVYSNGGGTVQDSGADPLEDDVNGSAKTRATAAGELYNTIIFIGGTNDHGSYVEATFTADLKDHIEEYMAENSYSANTEAEYMLLCTVPSKDNPATAATRGMNTVIKSMPAWWDAAYPSRAGRVRVVDVDAAFGGSDSDQTLFKTGADIHPASTGWIVMGEAIGAEIKSMLSGRSTASARTAR